MNSYCPESPPTSTPSDRSLKMGFLEQGDGGCLKMRDLRSSWAHGYRKKCYRTKRARANKRRMPKTQPLSLLDLSSWEPDLSFVGRRQKNYVHKNLSPLEKRTKDVDITSSPGNDPLKWLYTEAQNWQAPHSRLIQLSISLVTLHS